MLETLHIVLATVYGTTSNVNLSIDTMSTGDFVLCVHIWTTKQPALIVWLLKFYMLKNIDMRFELEQLLFAL